MRKQKPYETINLCQFIQNISAELERLACLAKACDDELGEMLEGELGGELGLDALQKIDLLNQSTQCVAIMMNNLLREDLPDMSLRSCNLTEGVFLQNLKKAGTR